MAARKPSSSVTTVDWSSRVAMTSTGMFLGLGFARNLHSVQDVIELLRSGSITGTIFVGVLINDSGAPGLKAYEGTEETTAKSKSGRSRTRRDQR